MVIIIKTRTELETDPPIVTHNPDGTLTRQGALIEARKLWGELGTISSDERLPRLVWSGGDFYATVGRGRTWEMALQRSAYRKKRAPAAPAAATTRTSD